MAIYEITAPNGQTLEIEGDTPPTEADLDEIFKSTKTAKEPTRPRSRKGFFDYNNEDLKADYQNLIDKRQEWEQNHPYISSLQKDFQPGYRSSLTDWEEKAKYGINAPLGVQAKNLGKRYLQEAIPAANLTTAVATGGMLNGANGLLPLIGRGAAQGAIQGGVLGATSELGDNGLSLNVIPKTLKGTALGATVGAVLPVGAAAVKKTLGIIPMTGNFISNTIGRVQPETIQRAVNPESKALDLSSKSTLMDFATDLTNKVRNTYNNILKNKGEAIQAAEENLRNIPDRVNVDDVIGDITNTFDQYQGENINAARNLTGNLESNLNDLVESGTQPKENFYNYINDTEKPDFYSKEKEAEAYKILSEATGKPVNWLRSQLNSNNFKGGTGKRKEFIEDLLEKTDDKLDLLKHGNDNDYKYYYNANLGYNNINDTQAGYNLARQAYDDIVNRNFSNEMRDPLSRELAGAEQNYKYILRNVLENSRDENIMNEAFNKLEKSIKGLPEEVQADYVNKFTNDVENILQGRNTISPIDLQKIKQQVGQMTNWADTTRPKIQNTVLEQVYGKINNRLQNLSPELAQANKNFANIKSFQDKEGISKILQPGDKVDRATTVLDNFDATYNKGNTFNNVKDLENVFVKEGYEPFINDVQDIVAAKDLNNIRTTGDSFWANLATGLTRPALKLARAYNRSPLPQAFGNIRNVFQRAAIPFMYNAPRLYGDVNYDEYLDE